MSDGLKKRRVSRKERSQQLLDLTLDLVAERGLGAFSMTELARLAGVGKPVVYRIYPNRAAVLLALLRREQKRVDGVFDRAIPADPGDVHPRVFLVGVMDEILSAVEERPQTWRLLLVPPEGMPRMLHKLIERRRAQLVVRARRLIDWGAPYLVRKDDLDLDALAHVLVSIIEAQARMVVSGTQGGKSAVLASADAVVGTIEWTEPPPG